MRQITLLFVFIALVPVFLMLGGCGQVSEFRAQHILSDGWVGPTAEEERASLYCYRTIGTPMCYQDPLPDAEDRLIGSYTGAGAAEMVITPAQPIVQDYRRPINIRPLPRE